MLDTREILYDELPAGVALNKQTGKMLLGREGTDKRRTQGGEKLDVGEARQCLGIVYHNGCTGAGNGTEKQEYS